MFGDVYRLFVVFSVVLWSFYSGFFKTLCQNVFGGFDASKLSNKLDVDKAHNFDSLIRFSLKKRCVSVVEYVSE